MKRRVFLQNAGLISVSPLIPSIPPPNPTPSSSLSQNHRKLWLDFMIKLTGPVLTSLASDQLKEKMPVEAHSADMVLKRAKYTHLEAFGRVLMGIAPWLQLDVLDDDEKKLQDKYFNLAIKCITNAVNPDAKDYMNWGDEGGQPLVDASFFAYALIRCPKLWQQLDAETRKRVIFCLSKTRNINPPANNWLLFTAMIEVFFITANKQYDIKRIDYAISQHAEWYKGDGLYGDGKDFHWDYYNSFVIHPFLYDILKILAVMNPVYEQSRKTILLHNLRYAQILEHLIGVDGTYPAVGRSITYRTGAFHHLANMALNHQLPQLVKPAQVRCALTAVIQKIAGANDMFDKNGWLQIGLYGHQPLLAEPYISTGSLYFCSNIFLPLGLPATDDFWSLPDEDWSEKKIWNGLNVAADHSI